MLHFARNYRVYLPIPLPLHRALFAFRWVVLYYFLYAIAYDFLDVVMKVISAALGEHYSTDMDVCGDIVASTVSTVA